MLKYACGSLAFWVVVASPILGMMISGCSAPPDLTGYPANTPKTYSENKVFFLDRLEGDAQYEQLHVDLEHLYEVRTDKGLRREDVINPNDPVSVVLQGVRLPEDAYSGTRDIAVVLDIHTSNARGTTTLVAFYQRDVPAGQMLNFNNLLVYADPQWDERTAPYFRIRVLDVKAERNRRTGAIMEKVGNISAQIGGMIPHPAVPIVTTAIDAAGLILSNQRNKMLLDYQIQFYGSRHRNNAGGATLGPLVAGPWIVVGRGRGADSSFWTPRLYLDRQTDRLMHDVELDSSVGTSGEACSGEACEGVACCASVVDGARTNVPVPYVLVTLMRADAQVPKLVLDRSETLMKLLSSPTGKSDIDAVTQASENLMSAIGAFAVEGRLRKYRSTLDLQEIIDKLDTQGDQADKLNPAEERRLMYVLDRVTGNDVSQTTAAQWVDWWESLTHADWELVEDAHAPMGVIYRKKHTVH